MEEEEKKKLKIDKYKSLNLIPSHTDPFENEDGVINLNWIKSITTVSPSTIVYYYYISSMNVKEEEKKMYNEIANVKNQYKFMPIILIVIKGDFTFAFEELSITELVDKNNIYLLNSNDSLKLNDIKKMRQSLKLASKAYYKKIKEDIKSIIINTDNAEVKCKCEFKLAILSLMCTKQNYLKTKHFQNAYNILCSINLNSYLKNESNICERYVEIKNEADWIFNKIISFSNQNNKEKINSLIQRFNLHFHLFSKFDFYQNEPNKHILYTFEYFWRYLKYNELINYIKSNKKEVNYNTFVFILLRAYYNLKRLTIYLNQYLDINEGDNIVSKLKTNYSNYYEKLPVFLSYDNPLNPNTVKFDYNIAIKKMIFKNNINKDTINKFNTELLSLYYDTVKLSNNHTEINNYMGLIINDYDNKYIINLLEDKNLLKFPNVYYYFVQKYTDQLISYFDNEHTISKDNRNALIKNIIILANNRKLNEKEEKLFNILNKENTTESTNQDNNIIINDIDINNNIFSVKLSIKNSEKIYRRVLDLVEYEISLNTNIDNETLELENISLYFNNERKPKTYNQNYTLSKSTPINLEHKLMLKDSDKLLYITKIQFKLKSINDITYEIVLPNKLENTIIIKSLDKNVLKFNSPEQINIGNEVYYNCEIEIQKDDTYNVQIGQLDISFKTVLTGNNIGITTALNNVHELYFYDKNNNKLSEYNISIPNLEEYFKTNGNTVSFLIKSKSYEKFIITYTTVYQILQKEVEDDSIELKNYNKIEFQVIPPFNTRTDLFSNIYKNAQNKIIYSTNKNIQEMLILKNLLDMDITIKSIEIQKNEDDYEIESPMNEYISMDPNISKFVKNSEYTIPFNLLFKSEYFGIPGKVVIEWTTENLQKYSEKILNKSTFELADIKVSELYIDFEYKINSINEENYLCEIIVENKKNAMKKVTFQTDMSNEFIIQGFNKKHCILLPKEKKPFKLVLTPTDFGNIKLPPIKVREFDTKGDKIDSVYYFPDYLEINIIQ